MKKRIGSLLLVVAMCLTLLPTAAFAVDDEETAAAPEKFVITSVSDLQTFADAVNEGDYDGKTDAVVTLDADLDLAGIAWTPMGDTSHDFAGTFDGQGHTISGNVKKCAVGKHPKSEKHGNTAQFSEVERSGTQENCGGIGSGCRLRLRPLPVLRRRQSQRVARIDPNAVVVDKNIAENDRFDLFSR